ncbi:FAD-binding oxidoreductase [Novosphingobium sp. JCM 18896]|uniref:FAD-binding oxidoreductase n=1 Tax=Novosphingobium sp. JCM 18896 TaxID=2989731 RepID=UPI0022217C77|nr:FAD-binding oxidoreductase [Novosphingobium sp. JCM 18896]MCW1429715.1 FAD-binding oxidoreductase [Novosphingobium sp. JCM 18896]
MMISGWGRYPRQDCVVHSPRSEADLRGLVERGPAIARGNGRGYGDCAQQPANTVSMLKLNRMLAFDADTGLLVVEAGVLLAEVIDAFLPRGWFPPVTPGTKFVTLGGMVAADVHGKNHHRDGSFGRFVAWLDLLDGTGEVRRCSAQSDPELFAATIGGMGLTGVILRVAFHLQRVESGWIRQTTLPAPDLDTAMRLFEDHADVPYSVAWIDCLAGGRSLGRSAIMLGEHAVAADLPEALRMAPFRTPRRKLRNVPFDAPAGLLNGLTVRAFNAVYYRRQVMKRGLQLVDWDSYFYPLDALGQWNRIYGGRGLLQFQCALPLASARAGLAELLAAISASGQGSFLAVLKRLGGLPGGTFSFPLDGYTLALDFPVSAKVLALMERLDAIVLAHGGRFYLAKDSRMSAATLRASDRRVPQFLALRQAEGAAAFASSQSERLEL